jgi:hypothetical protein
VRIIEGLYNCNYHDEKYIKNMLKKNNIKINKEKLQLIVEKLFKTCKYKNQKEIAKIRHLEVLIRLREQ